MKKKSLKTILVAGAIVMCMASTAFATNSGVPVVGNTQVGDAVKVSVTKKLELAEGLSVPEASFDFIIEKVSADAPVATIAPVRYVAGEGKGKPNNGKYVLNKKSEIIFAPFPHAGEFEYRIRETKGTLAGVEYSQESYFLRVQVANGENGTLNIKAVTAEKGTETGNDANKTAEISFTNTYRKNASLTIEKKTEGEMADKTKAFEFQILLRKSPTETAENQVYKARLGNEIIDVQEGRIQTFYLKDGESLVFDQLPVGTNYTVVETGTKDGYTPRVFVTANGVQEKGVVGTDAEDLASSKNGHYVGENQNLVTYVNEYREVPLTGLADQNMPFILLIGASAAAIIVLVIAKKRKSSM